jgi:uncharacterized protein YjbI with pentapeptide repeats
MTTAQRSASVDLRGRELTAGQLPSELSRPDAWDEAHGRWSLAEANFEGATFRGRIDFTNALFQKANFRGATFTGSVTFNGAEFQQEACFHSTTFEGTASFREATFRCDAFFELPRGEEVVRDWPEEVTFRRWADFRRATFCRSARFGGALFERRARFDGATFNRDAVFTGASFPVARTIDLKDVKRKIDLDRVAFGAPVRIDAGARRISCQGTQFQSLAAISVHRGDLVLKDAAFAESSTVAGVGSNPKPRVRSLEGADVAHLTLADLDLRECTFLGAHNLDGLRLEGAIELCSLGPGLRDRTVITDEVDFHARDWPKGDKDAKRVCARRVADAYRALRKGREDSKDAPGAADFYYGEMQMRRQAAKDFDWWLLHGYWATSGYALIAWRALAALAVTVLAVAGGLELLGYENKTPGYGDSVLYSLESTTSLFRSVPTLEEGVTLSDWGRGLQMLLRLLGPLFFGLFLLALRGRVKR